MTYTGHIKNGVAVLDQPINLPDGTPVRIEIDRAHADFWRGKSLDELTREQGVQPCTDPDDIAGEWPESESVEDFNAMIRKSRV